MGKIKEWIKTNYLQLIIIIALFMAVIGLFLPYQKATDNYREELLEKPEESYAKELWLDNKDVVNLSILENFKIFNYTVSHSEDNEWLYEESVLNIVIIITLISSIVLTTIFGLLKKHKLTIVFDIILALSSLLMNVDVVLRGAMPSPRYTYGISFYLYIVVAIIILVCSIIQIYLKKHKKAEPEKKDTKTKRINETKNQKKEQPKKEKRNILELLKNNSNKIYIAIIAILLIIILIMIITPNNDTSNYKNGNCECPESETFDDEEDVDNADDEENSFFGKENNNEENSNNQKGTFDLDSSGKENNIEYKTSISSNGKMIIFATNKNDNLVNVEIEVEFYDKDDELVGVGYSSVSAMSQKSTSALEIYNTPKEYKYYKIYIETSESDDYSYTNKLKATHKKTDDKIVVQVKNNTKKEIETIKVAIVYYKGKKIVGYDDSLHLDIKADRAANFEFRPPYNSNTWEREDYDRYEIYINEAYTYNW